MPREATLAKALVELADTLVADFDVVDLLTILTDRCVDVLDVAAAGVMVVAPAGDLRLMASSSETMRALELFELLADEGPCLDCFLTGRPVVQRDLAATASDWPRFSGAALAAGFRSVQALPMRLRGTVLGALNLFHVHPGKLRPADLEAGQALADVAKRARVQVGARPPPDTVCGPRPPTHLRAQWMHLADRSLLAGSRAVPSDHWSVRHPDRGRGRSASRGVN